MAIGALCVSMVLKAESGTWPPFGNALVDCIGEAPLALLEPVEFKLACDAVAELVGPLLTAVPVPPATTELLMGVAPVRIKRARRSSGVLWKVGCTSRITWYWLSCVNMVETCRCPYASYKV